MSLAGIGNLRRQVVEASRDYTIIPAEFSEIIGTISSIFVGVFVLGTVGMLIGGLNKCLMVS